MPRRSRSGAQLVGNVPRTPERGKRRDNTFPEGISVEWGRNLEGGRTRSADGEVSEPVYQA